MNKTTLGLIAVIVLIVGVVAGHSFWPVHLSPAGAQNPSGTTYGSAKFAGVVADMSTTSGTSTSILNTDATDRFITSWKFACEGVGTSQTAYTGTGLAAWTVKVATSSTASPATLTGAASVANSFTLATGTTALLVSSSTPQTATSSFAAIWNAGSYLTFSTNATNSAVCTVGGDYIGS